MEQQDKQALLRSLKLFRKVPDEQLRQLCEFLRADSFPDGGVVFEEGSSGDSLYFVSQGHIRIAKKLRSAEVVQTIYKELAVLAPGDCFGEMALIEQVARSADAIAMGETVLFSLSRTDLERWLAANPALAMGFFAQLVQVLSSRLRVSSNELTLLYDLSNLLLEPFASPKALLDRVMSRLMRYLEGRWCAGAYVYNEFNEEMDLVDAEGDFYAVKDRLTLPEDPKANAWLDDSTYQAVLPGKKRPLGFIIFHREEALDEEEKNEFARTITTSGRLVTSALENIGYRTEEDLRARLKSSRQAGGF